MKNLENIVDDITSGKEFNPEDVKSEDRVFVEALSNISRILNGNEMVKKSKLTKDEVGYVEESDKKSAKYGTVLRCATCRFFVKKEDASEQAVDNGKCTKVDGDINPRGWCKLHESGWGPARAPETDQVRLQEVVMTEKVGRASFDVREGDKGRCVVDEHILGLDETQSMSFESVKTYESFLTTRKKLKGQAAVHIDFRIHIGHSDYWVGFETGSFSMDKDNPLINPGSKKFLIPAFKQRGRDFDWLNKVGVNRASEWIGSRGTPTRLYQIEDCEIEFGRVEQHVIEFWLKDTKHIAAGRYLMMAAPLGKQERTWLLSYKG